MGDLSLDNDRMMMMQGPWMRAKHHWINSVTSPQHQVCFGRGERADPALLTSESQQEVMELRGHCRASLMNQACCMGRESYAESFDGSASSQQWQTV